MDDDTKPPTAHIARVVIEEYGEELEINVAQACGDGDLLAEVAAECDRLDPPVSALSAFSPASVPSVEPSSTKMHLPLEAEALEHRPQAVHEGCSRAPR